jgi:hypothetical protein
MPYKIRMPKEEESLPSEELFDRLQTVQEQLSEQPRLVWGVVITLVLLMGAGSAFWFFQRQSNRKAWDLSVEAAQLVLKEPSSPVQNPDPKQKIESRSDRLAKAGKLYETILEKYSATPAANLAQYEAGNTYFELEKYDQAELFYLAFLKKQENEKEKGLLSIVRLKLAYLYQKQGDVASASDQFRMVYEGGEPKGALRDQAGFELARLLAQQEKKSEATEIYKKVSEEFTDSPWGTEAKAQMALLDPSVIPVMASAPGQAPGLVPVSPNSVPTPAPSPVSVQAPAPKLAPPVPPTVSKLPLAPVKAAPSPPLAAPPAATPTVAVGTPPVSLLPPASAIKPAPTVPIKTPSSSTAPVIPVPVVPVVPAPVVKPAPTAPVAPVVPVPSPVVPALPAVAAPPTVAVPPPVVAPTLVAPTEVKP